MNSMLQKSCRGIHCTSCISVVQILNVWSESALWAHGNDSQSCHVWRGRRDRDLRSWRRGHPCAGGGLSPESADEEHITLSECHAVGLPHCKHGLKAGANALAVAAAGSALFGATPSG